MAEQEEPQLSPRAQIKRLLRVVLRAVRYWPVMVIAATVAVAAAVLAPMYFRPVYKSETVLLYRQVIEARAVVGRDGESGGLGRNGGQRLREMLMSRTNLEGIVEELDLYPGTRSSLGMIEAINELRRSASCDVGRADSFTITFYSTDSDLAYRVTQRLADSLIEQSVRYSAKQAESTQGFLQTQNDRTKQELDDKEQKLAVFLAKHPEFAQNLANTSPGVSRRALDAQAGKPKAAAAEPTTPTTDPRVLALERQAVRIRKQLANDGSAGPAAPPAPPTIDPELKASIQQAQNEVARASSRLAEARASKTDSHPDVVSARGRLSNAQSKLKGLLSQVVAPAPVTPPQNVALSKDDRKSLIAQLHAIDDAIEAGREAADKGGPAPTPVTSTVDGDRIVALETEWTSLTRDVNALRERSLGLQRLLFNADIIATVQSSGEAAQMMVIDPPYQPKRPFKRGSRRVGAVAVMLVLLMGLGVAVALAFLDDRVYDIIDLERLHIGKLSHTVPAATAAAAAVPAAAAEAPRAKPGAQHG